jgi:hypothetical protein
MIEVETRLESMVRNQVGWAAANHRDGPGMWDEAAERLGFTNFEEVLQLVDEWAATGRPEYTKTEIAIELLRRRRRWNDTVCAKCCGCGRL